MMVATLVLIAIPTIALVVTSVVVIRDELKTQKSLEVMFEECKVECCDPDGHLRSVKMGRSLDGYLMLGWEVETEDVANYDEIDGDLSEDAEAKVTEILGKKWTDRWWCEPIVFPSLYYDCDYMYVGLVLMSDHCDNVEIEGYARHLLGNAELFEKTACDLYKVIVGSVPETAPKLMCVTCDG